MSNQTHSPSAKNQRPARAATRRAALAALTSGLLVFGVTLSAQSPTGRLLSDDVAAGRATSSPGSDAPASSSSRATTATTAATTAPATATTTTTTTTAPSAPSAAASEQSEFFKWWHGDYATGMWGGFRAKLSDWGITPGLNFEQDLVGNVEGGYSRGIAHSNNIEFDLGLDLGKLIGIKNTQLHIRFVDRNGNGLTQRRVGNFFPLQPNYNDEICTVQEISLRYDFIPNKLWIKAGRLASATEFGDAAVYRLYFTNSFNGKPKALASSNAFSCKPGAVWGGMVNYTINENWYARAGVYQTTNRLYSKKNNGFSFDVTSDDGVLAVAMAGFDPIDKTTGEVIGHYHAGAYTAWWDINRFDGNGTEDFTYVFFLHGDHAVWRFEPSAVDPKRTGAGKHMMPSRNLSLWATFVLAPVRSVQVLPWQISGGAFIQGPFAKRRYDKILLGATYGDFSSDYARQQQHTSPRNEKPSGETVIELAYMLQLTQFFFVQPDVQYVIKPKGFSHNSNGDDVVVLGIRASVTF